MKLAVILSSLFRHEPPPPSPEMQEAMEVSRIALRHAERVRRQAEREIAVRVQADRELADAIRRNPHDE